jgi:hypothetical protein
LNPATVACGETAWIRVPKGRQQFHGNNLGENINWFESLRNLVAIVNYDADLQQIEEYLLTIEKQKTA